MFVINTPIRAAKPGALGARGEGYKTPWSGRWTLGADRHRFVLNPCLTARRWHLKFQPLHYSPPVRTFSSPEMWPERKHNEPLSRPLFSRASSPSRTGTSQRCLHAWGPGGILMTVLSSRLFLRLVHYRRFHGLAGSSLLCATAPQIVISLWPLHKGPFARLRAGARGRGKLIQQPEPGAVWEPFCLGSWAGSL